MEFMKKGSICMKKVIFDLVVSLMVFSIFFDCFTYAQHGRVAPGVNPNKYQQEVPAPKQGMNKQNEYS